MDTRIGILGAAFDPPTHGHKNVVEQALKVFDKIYLIPSVDHAFGKKMSPFEHRVKMLEFFAKNWPEDKVSINLIEQDLLKQNGNGPIYTFDVLQALENQKSPETQYSFIIGPDNAKHWLKFYKAEEITKTWNVFQAKEEMSIHSTDVRNIIHEDGESPEQLMRALDGKVEAQVAQYIIENNLYI